MNEEEKNYVAILVENSLSTLLSMLEENGYLTEEKEREIKAEFMKDILYKKKNINKEELEEYVENILNRIKNNKQKLKDEDWER